MFSLFKRKMQISIMIIIILVAIIHYMFITISYTSILKNDFTSKAQSFNYQYKTNVEDRIESVENQGNLFVKKYFEEEMLFKYDSQMNKTLSKLKTFSTDILGAFIYGRETQKYYSDSRYTSIMLVEKELYNLLGSDMSWMLVDVESDGKQSLFHQIDVGNGANLFIEVNPEIFIPKNNDSIFYDDAHICIEFNNQSESMIIEDNAIEYSDLINGSTFDKGKNNLVFENKVCKDIVIKTDIPCSMLKHQFFEIRLVAGIIILIFIIAAYITVYIFSEKIEDYFQKMCKKIKHFEDELRLSLTEDDE